MKIQVVKDYTTNFEGDVYTIDLSRKFEGFEPGDLICYACPFSPAMPLQLESPAHLPYRLAARRKADRRKYLSCLIVNTMTNPAHQSHKVSGVSHYTTVSVLQDSHPLSALCKPVYLHREV